MYQILASFLLLILSTNISFSQKTEKEKSDELQFLKGQSVLNLQFDYQNMLVGEKTEELYLQETRENKNSREAGTGDRWLFDWNHNKQEDFPRRFKVLFNKYLEPKNLKVAKDTLAPYTLTVKTLKIEPGYETGTVARMPTMADMVFILTESNNPDKVLCKLRIRGIEGDAAFASFDAGLRMQECYARAGRTLAKYFLKYAYKK